VATGAGMFRPIGMNASHEPCRLVGMAGLALDGRHLIRMRIVLDGGMAIAAFQAAVNAGPELRAIHADTAPGGVLQGLIPVAGEAIGLRRRHARRRENQKRPKSERNRGYSLHIGSDRSLHFLASHQPGEREKGLRPFPSLRHAARP